MIDVERSVEVVNLVLQDAGEPSLGGEALASAMFIEVTDADAAIAWDLGEVTCNAQAAFEKVDLCTVFGFQMRINEDMEGNWHSSASAQLLGAPGTLILFAIFDDCELQAEPNLRRRQAYAGREAEGFKHIGNSLLDFGAADFIGAKGTRELP